MSGGSWDYLYRKIYDASEQLLFKSRDPSRRAFASHLSLVAKAMHDIEWVDSGDCSMGEEIPAIEAALGGNHKELVLEELVKEGKDILIKLTSTLEKIKNDK